MRQARAIEIGRDAVDWLIARPDRLVELATASGVALGDLPALVADPDFPGAVLDFVLSSDETVLDFAAHAGLRPEEPAVARATLGAADRG